MSHIVKAVILRPIRRNLIVKIKPRKLLGQSFRAGGNVYFVDGDRFMLTEERSPKRGWMRQYFSTYYYIEGVPYPLPVPLFDSVVEPIRNEDGTVATDDEGRPRTHRVFPEVLDLGVHGDDLEALFNPYFLRAFVPNGATVWEKMQMLLLVGIAIGVGYVAYTMGNIPTAEEIVVAIRGG